MADLSFFGWFMLVFVGVVWGAALIWMFVSGVEPD